MIFDIINKDPGFMSSDALDFISEPGTYNFIERSSVGDSKQHFLRSLEEKPKDWYYRTHKVEYTLNSHKFRTKEFKDIDWKNSIVLIGCSCTFGTGVTDDDTIAAYLQKITGKYVVNLGQPAASNGVIAYNSYYLKENYPTPLAVVNIWTTIARWFWIRGNKQLLFELFDYKLFADSNKLESMDMKHPGSQYISEDKLITEATNNILYMKMSNALWKDHPNYLQLSRHDYPKNGKYISMAAKVFPEIIQLKHHWANNADARDNLHWGRQTNKEIAKMIASNLKL